MKYGLVVYKDTDNIGDDILSYAAMRFLPRIDYIIDRIGFLLKGTIRTCLVRPEPEGILYKVEPGQEQAE